MEEILKLLGMGGTVAADLIEPTGILSGGIGALTNILTGSAGNQSMDLAKKADEMKNQDYLNYGVSNASGTIGQPQVAQQFKTQNNAPRYSAEATEASNKLGGMSENLISQANQNILGAKTAAAQQAGSMRRGALDKVGAGALGEISERLGEGSAAGGQQILSQGAALTNQAYGEAAGMIQRGAGILAQNEGERQNELMAKYGAKFQGYNAGESPLIGSSYGENLNLGAKTAENLGGMTKSLMGGHAGQLDAYKLLTDWIAGRKGTTGATDRTGTTGTPMEAARNPLDPNQNPFMVGGNNHGFGGATDYGNTIFDMTQPGYEFQLGGNQSDNQLDNMMNKKFKNTLPWFMQR